MFFEDMRIIVGICMITVSTFTAIGFIWKWNYDRKLDKNGRYRSDERRHDSDNNRKQRRNGEYHSDDRGHDANGGGGHSNCAARDNTNCGYGTDRGSSGHEGDSGSSGCGDDSGGSGSND